MKTKIAVTYENGEVFQHFGHTKEFKFYTVEDKKIVDSEIVPTMGSGHSMLADFLLLNGVTVLICGGIGGGAKAALAQKGIELRGGVSGNADEKAQAYVDGTLEYNAAVECTHDHDHDHECHEHDHGHEGHHHDHDHECHGHDHGHEGHDHDHECHEHHHDHGHDHECHEHDHDHGHEGHDHDHECHEHSHDHHHDHAGHHHHHHADEVFTSWGMETIVPVTRDQLEDVLKRLSDTKEFGDVLRAKGMLPTENPGEWLYFDLVPQQYEIRDGRPDYTGKVCVIGANLNEGALNQVFGRG